MPRPHEPAITVVIADDHATVRAGIRLFLEMAGDIRVLAEASDGREAIRAIEALEPAVAIIDIHMPGASGIEVVQWVRVNAPATSVLVLTAYDDACSARSALDAGARGFLAKSAGAAEIVAAVRELVEGRPVLGPQVAREAMRSLTGAETEASVTRPTDRELEILILVARGQTNKSIGYSLGISHRTVQSHIASICGKLRAGSRTEAVMRAVAFGWVPPDAGR